MIVLNPYKGYALHLLLHGEEQQNAKGTLFLMPLTLEMYQAENCEISTSCIDRRSGKWRQKMQPSWLGQQTVHIDAPCVLVHVLLAEDWDVVRGTWWARTMKCSGMFRHTMVAH